ncbi:glycosyltransferase [Thiocapsa rosea]|uniref:GT2 family glycosyltransferase n=1 Tax=Thiocapsa rosea TaxID=69360 RepID=A0A495V7H5_9GAMM|nr:glycosyltransferase [Thiocapsa rosea]RKT44465.1 GT2 family glycosyltransferase [Thiocapsa rosea]
MSPPKTTCDIVMPVYNGLTYAAECIASVIDFTAEVAYRLIIVDDASDTFTSAFLEQVARQHDPVSLIRNPENLGFVQSCIRGYEAGDAPYLLLLNSDVVVTPGWLERLLACAAADERIASVNPLTNHAAHLALPMFPGANFLGMDALLSEGAPRCADVVTGEGFCMLLRRSVLKKEGFLDPVYGRGYCEESDLCMRLTTRGYRTVVAENVYVYHRGSGTFGRGREARYLANRRIFDARWSREYRRQFAAFRTADPLRQVRSLIPHRTRAVIKPVIWQTGRAVLSAVRSRQPVAAARAAVRGLLALPRARIPVPEADAIGRVTRPGRLRVTYILDRLLVAGGVLSVIQLVNALILQGVEARIATLFEDPLVHDWSQLYTRPIVYRDAREMIEQFPPTDVVVATLWTTAPWAKAVLDAGRAQVAVYFLQDYEPWFFPATRQSKRAEVEATFGMLRQRIVMSDWLAQMMAARGYETHKISLGMDLRRFYPRDTVPGPPTVSAMARPLTPHRGFEATIEALRQVKASRPDVEIRLFGDSTLRRYAVPFEYKDEGVIADQDRLARLYSSSDVFLDGSDFQGFGRCGLEAMACGAACVLTDVGGVNEYARHGENALLAPPREPTRLTEAILALLNDPDRRADMTRAGRETAQRFCHRREALETLEYFHGLMNIQGQA